MSLAGILVSDDEGRRGDRVSAGVGRIDRREAQVGRQVGQLVAGLGGAVQRWGNVLAGLVLDGRRSELVLEGVGQLDIADGALSLASSGGDSGVAATTSAGRPLDCLAGAYLPRPRRADIGQELRELGGRA